MSQDQTKVSTASPERCWKCEAKFGTKFIIVHANDLPAWPLCYQCLALIIPSHAVLAKVEITCS